MRELDLKDYVRDKNGREVCVSTIDLCGVDHRFGQDGPPLIFETMIFEAEDGEIVSFTELWAARYATELEATLSHYAVVKMLQETDEEFDLLQALDKIGEY